MHRTRMTRRRVLQLSAAVAAATAAAACAGATGTPVPREETAAPAAAEAPAAAGEAVTVTIFVGMGTGTAPEQQEAQNRLAAEWNASHTDIKIEHMYVPHDESRTKWAAMLAAGTPPAINMPSGVEQVGRFRDTNLDIGPYVERDQYDLSDFGDLIPEIGKYQGVMYGIVMGVYPSVLYYNEDLFDAAEVDYPTQEWEAEGWTYDALVEMARQLSQDGSGRRATEDGFDPADQVQWGYDEVDCGLGFNALAVAWGAENMGWSEDFRTLYFNAPAWVDRLQWASDAIWKWYIMPSAQQSQASAPGFNTGKLGIDHCHSWRMGEMEELPFHWNVGAIPASPLGITLAQCDVDGFLICNQFAHLDAAWEVAKWMLEPDQMLRLDLTWGALPPRASLQERYKEEMAARFPNLQLQVFFDSLNYIDVPNHESYIPRYGEVWDAFWAGYDRILTGEQKDAQIVLDEVQATVQGYLDDYWAEQG
ncbi:MAG: extracellular solute-binding protein [Anaerolineae bacterium]|nr:extracellular solute-binding protein [Anaerolineae bacterium]